MAKPNYPFEKRQRELAKKRKQEEKDSRKRNARTDASPQPVEPASAPEEPVATATVPVGPRIHRRTTAKEDGTP